MLAPIKHAGLVLLLLLFQRADWGQSRSITLADYYDTTGALAWGEYTQVVDGPNGQPLVLQLKGRSTDCRLKYHHRTERLRSGVVQQAGSATKGDGYIPVLGITAPKDPKMFLLRLIYSIDYPVHDLVLVTGGDDAHLADELSHIKENVMNVTHIHCSSMQSVTQGWNQILTTYMEAPWMLVTAIDVQFLPGALSRFADRFWAEKPLGLEMAHFTYLNLRIGDYNQKFNAFGVTRSFVDRLGLFDENIWPAYCEDEEWMVRSSVSGVRMNDTTFLGVKAFHGRRATDTKHLSGITHMGPLAQLARSRHLRNCMYLKVKWGCTRYYSQDCKYRAPFNLTEKPISYWRFNVKPFLVPSKGDPLAHGLVTPDMVA